MADFVFTRAKGKARQYTALPASNDALVVVLLKVAEADSTLAGYADLGSLLAGANTEATFTHYARKIVTSVFETVDTLNRWVLEDIPDQTWALAGGAANNTLVKLLICYDPDTGSGTDADLIPLTAHDFSVTTTGSDLTAEFNTSGFYKAA